MAAAEEAAGVAAGVSSGVASVVEPSSLAFFFLTFFTSDYKIARKPTPLVLTVNYFDCREIEMKWREKKISSSHIYIVFEILFYSLSAHNRIINA